jgi:hypothetical protein
MALIRNTTTAPVRVNVKIAVRIVAARAATNVVHPLLSNALIRPLSCEE